MLCTQRSDPVPCLVCPLPCTDASSQHILPLCRLSSSSIAVYYILGGLHNEGRISNQTSQNLFLLGGCCRHLLACNFGSIPNKKHREVNAYNAGLSGRLESNKKTMMADTGAVFCSPVWWLPESQIFGNKMQI